MVKNAGHEQVATHPKATATMVRFLKGGPVDTIALAYPKLKFIPLKGKSGKVWHSSLGER